MCRVSHITASASWTSWASDGFWYSLVLGSWSVHWEIATSKRQTNMNKPNINKLQTASNCFCFKALSPSQYSHLSFLFTLSKPQYQGFLTAEFSADFCLAKGLKVCQGTEGWAENAAVISEYITYTAKAWRNTFSWFLTKRDCFVFHLSCIYHSWVAHSHHSHQFMALFMALFMFFILIHFLFICIYNSFY